MTVLIEKPHVGLLPFYMGLIDDREVVTWEYNDFGWFTHVPDQWQGRAWFRPCFGPDQLAFHIVPAPGTQMTRLVYGIYHGRFIESMLMHCDKLFQNIGASALATADDVLVMPSVPLLPAR